MLINQLDPTLENVATLLTRSHDRSARPLKNFALFYVFLAPWLLGLGTGMVFSQLGMNVNWLKLAFYLLLAMALSTTFSIDFCIAFLLPFSIAVAVWSCTSLTAALGILFSLMLGLAYGLTSGSARWGLIAGLVYAVALGFLLGPLNGLMIGAAFLAGYFRVLFYLVEAPLASILAHFAARGDALKLWQFNPVVWDELIWFPLPQLDQHLLALRKQNEQAAQDAILHVKESFRQGWAVQRILE